MIEINKDYHLELSSEFSDELSELAVKIGDFIKDKDPFERYYALRCVLDELETRVTFYGVIDIIKKDGFNSAEAETPNSTLKNNIVKDEEKLD